MKKFFSVLMVVIFVIVLATGCTVESSSDGNESESVIDSSGNNLGVDISALDDVAAHEIAHEITENFSEYVGTKLKVKGHYESVQIDGSGEFIHGVAVEDPSLCCNPVFEFELKGEHSFPEDYPEQNSEIIIEGILKTKENNGAVIYYLDIDDINTL